MNARRLVLAALCTMTGALVFSGAPALAATNNAYSSQFNGSLTAAGSFAPSALAVNSSGDVYVAAYNVVDEFNPEGTKVLAEFPGSETKEGSFSTTEGIAVNSSGDVYVADDEHYLVDEFNPTGTAVLAEFNGGKTAGGSFYPGALAVNSTSGDVYVDAYYLVDEFSPPATGKSEPIPLAEFNGGKTEAKSFGSTGLAVNSSGDVYVGDDEHGVVDEFSPPATGKSEPKPLRELKGSQTPQGSFHPFRVAVDPGADVYVTDREHEHGVVDRFAGASGAYESQFEGGATPQGSFSEYPLLAAGPSGEVYVTGPTGEGIVDLFSEPVTVPAVTTGPAEDIQEASVTLTGSIEPSGGLEASCEFRYGTTSSYGSTAACVPAGPFSTSFNEVRAEITGLQPETAYHYRLEGTTSSGTTPGADETVTTAARLVSPPTVSIEPVTAIGEHSATFSGEVNPNESETTYHFEYSTDGVSWIALKEESAGKGTSEVPVTQTASGLTGHTPYRVRLVAVNSCGTGTTGCGTSTAEATFSTLAATQQVSGTGATDITAGAATLRTTIHTENEPTTYRFEYGPTASYGSTVPAGEGDLGASSTPTQVSEALTGLAPDTTYHFRVVASNGIGSLTTTADQTFTTYSSAQASTGCPNEQVRKESDVNPETGVPFSTQLPECRAYEMVSPPLKNGSPLTAASYQVVAAGSIVNRVGSEGSTVLIQSTGDWPGGEQPANNNLLTSQASEAVRYRVTRGESGWGFKPEVPPASDLQEYETFATPKEADMSPNGIWGGFGFSPSEQQLSIFGGNFNFYFLEPSGALAEVGPSAPLGAISFGGYGSTGPGGASTDLSRMLFDLSEFRWPFDQTKLSLSGPGIPSLYEYIGTGHTGEGTDVPTLVGVDNTGALISQCGAEPGGGYVAVLQGASAPETRAISGGGSTVFFTALASGPGCLAGSGGGPLVNQVFARIGEPGTGAAAGSAVTVNVAASPACASSDSCNVTKAVSYQGASKDGSKVFFTSEQPLVAGDTDTTNNLYECRLPGDSGAALARVAVVNPCPNLVRVSAPVSGGGAGVQSVVVVSQDGSHVYFIASGALTGANAEGASPTVGKENLYVWQEPSSAHPQGRTAFIATLPSAPGEAQATPDGESLVFTSSADLTADDTSTVSQVFLYEARHETLIRISRGQNDFNHDGNTNTDPATITPDSRRTISEDGAAVVFQSSDALTRAVHGGTRNVYLWRDGNVYLISDGTPAGEHVGNSSAGLVGIDPSGQNVFFTTGAQLVGQDIDELSDLYDARIGGGFPAPKVNECVGEACQGVFSAPSGSLSPGSLSPRAV